MVETNDILLAQQDQQKREEWISQHVHFICRCASKAAHRWIDPHDDLFSVALIAFDDAISAYHPQRGSFLSLAASIIRNRVTDVLRKEKRYANTIPFSALSQGEVPEQNQIFHTADSHVPANDAALEIAALQMELEPFQISFADLPSSSPKTNKTKAACRQVIRYLSDDPALLHELFQKRHLPIRQLHGIAGEKLLERHRKFIIAGVLICTGDFPHMQAYFCNQKEGAKS